MIRFEDIYEKVKRHQPGRTSRLLRKAYIFSARRAQGPDARLGRALPRPSARRRGHPGRAAHGPDLRRRRPAARRARGHADRRGQDEGALRRRTSPTSSTASPRSARSRSPSSEERQAETFRKMLLAMVDDMRVILVKLADRLHNMRTLQYLPEERRRRIARETMDIYAPIAGRLGMGKIKNELEDLSFQYLEPRVLPRARRSASRSGASAADRVHREDQGARWRRSCRRPASRPTSTGRVKRLYSIYQKLRTPAHRHRPGLRLPRLPHRRRPASPTATPPSACIHNLWRPVPGPDQGLHRDAEAQRLPVAAHDGDRRRGPALRGADPHARDGPGGRGGHRRPLEVQGRAQSARTTDDQAFPWLRQLLEWQQEVKDPHEFLNSLKLDLYPDEVYCSRRRARCSRFPRGATPLDFAYRIHTDVGHHCVGARVNGKIVPLRTPLKNGDIVEILTAAGHNPSRDWLTLVVTSRRATRSATGSTRSRSSTPWRSARKPSSKELKRYNLSARKMVAENALEAVAARVGVGGKLDDLYAAVGYGKVSMRQVLARFVPAEKLEAPAARRSRPPLADAVKSLLRVGDERDHGQGLGRPADLPRQVLQPAPGRADRRLHHARQGRLRALRRPAPTCAT